MSNHRPIRFHRHSLLNRLKDWGDQSSWQEFFDTYWQLIYNVREGRAGHGAEVVQETIIGVARKIGDFKADPAQGSFSGWLMQLTRWRIADQWRKRQRLGVQASACPGGDRGGGTLKRGHQTDDTGSTGEIERIPDPAGVALDAVWQEEWEKHLMAAALERVKRQVSPRQFQMFDLHVRQELSVADTARTLQASVASVYMAKHRVARLVKMELARLQKVTG
jgi:RNA polymerase sigma-70 factor (ECF subfamily)